MALAHKGRAKAQLDIVDPLGHGVFEILVGDALDRLDIHKDLFEQLELLQEIHQAWDGAQHLRVRPQPFDIVGGQPDAVLPGDIEHSGEAHIAVEMPVQVHQRHIWRD